MFGTLRLRDRGPALLIASVVLAAIWIGALYQVATIDSRARDAALARATQIDSFYAGDITTNLALIDNVLKFLASY